MLVFSNRALNSVNNGIWAMLVGKQIRETELETYIFTRLKLDYFEPTQIEMQPSIMCVGRKPINSWVPGQYSRNV
jgi:hypothetical protein